MAINKLISIKEAILEASEDMGFDLTRDKPTFAMWAVRAEKDIGSYFSYKRKRAVLTVTNCRAELPCNAAYLKAVVSGDQGCDCGEMFAGLLSDPQWVEEGVTLFGSHVFSLVDIPFGGTAFGWYSRYEIQDNCIVFASNMDGQKVTVEYLGLEEDCDGFVMVSENHKPAIIEFIMWKFCIRSRFSPIKMELGDLVMHQKEYFRLASDARAIDGELTPVEREACVAMLHDEYGGYGISVGQGLTYFNC